MRIMKFHVLDVANVVSQSVDHSGVNTVLKTEGLSENKRVILWMNFDRGGLLWIKLDDHLNWGFVASGFGGIINWRLISELRVKDFLYYSLGVGMVHYSGDLR